MTRVFSLGVCLLALACSSHSRPSKEEKKAQIYYSQGTRNLVKKNYTNALKYLLLAYELSPEDSHIHNNLGMAYHFKGKPKKAIKHLERAVELDQNNTDARNNLAGLTFAEARDCGPGGSTGGF